MLAMVLESRRQQQSTHGVKRWEVRLNGMQDGRTVHGGERVGNIDSDRDATWFLLVPVETLACDVNCGLAAAWSLNTGEPAQPA